MPHPDTPVPPHFLPGLDNALPSHADRTRIIKDEHRKRIIDGGMGSVGTVLVDGFVRGTWKRERTRGRESLVIEPLEPFSKEDIAALTAEGARLLTFIATGLDHDVRFAPSE